MKNKSVSGATAPSKKSSERESSIEAKISLLAKKLNLLPYKLVSPGTRGVPDRMFLGLHGRACYLEVKRAGEKPTALQRRTLDIWASRGHFAGYVDNVKSAEEFLRNFIAWEFVSKK